MQSWIPRKSLRNKEFLNFIPQTEFTSVEENRQFQGLSAGTDLFILLFHNSKS